MVLWNYKDFAEILFPTSFNPCQKKSSKFWHISLQLSESDKKKHSMEWHIQHIIPVIIYTVSMMVNLDNVSAALNVASLSSSEAAEVQTASVGIGLEDLLHLNNNNNEIKEQEQSKTNNIEKVRLAVDFYIRKGMCNAVRWDRKVAWLSEIFAQVKMPSLLNWKKEDFCLSVQYRFLTAKRVFRSLRTENVSF